MFLFCIFLTCRFFCFFHSFLSPFSYNCYSIFLLCVPRFSKLFFLHLPSAIPTLDLHLFSQPTDLSLVGKQCSLFLLVMRCSHLLGERRTSQTSFPFSSMRAFYRNVVQVWWAQIASSCFHRMGYRGCTFHSLPCIEPYHSVKMMRITAAEGWSLRAGGGNK